MNYSFNKTRDLSYLLFALFTLIGVVVLLLNCRRLWPFTVDDAFIIFRYSKNLAEGIGPTFNTVGEHAEGYTSFLWMLVMTLPHLLGFGVVSFAKLAGILAMLGTMALMAVFLWHAGAEDARKQHMLAAGLVILLLGYLPETAVHAISGMETAGYMFLLTGLVLLTYLALKGADWARNWLPLVALLTSLMRPEANLMVVILLVVVWLSSGQHKGFMLLIIFIYLIPGVLYSLWRWNYFGVLFPLPFYIKTGGPGLPGLPIVFPFITFLLANLGLYMGVGVFGERRAVLLLLLVILPNLLFFMFSYPIMNFDYRFVYPLLPLALILVGMGLAILIKQAENWADGMRWAKTAPAWVALFVLVMFLGQNLTRTGIVQRSKLEYAQSMARIHYTIGRALKQAMHSGAAPVLVVTDAGAIPYFSEWYTLDAGGLNDPNIALGRVQPVEYVIGENPEVVVLTSTRWDVYQNDIPEVEAIYHRALADGLVVAARAAFYQDGSTIWVLARPGGEAFDQLNANFSESP